MITATLYRIIPALVACLLAACGQSTPDAAPAAPTRAETPAAAATTQPPATAGNLIRMRVDGVEWAADREIVCMVDPPGMGTLLIVSGSKGPKDANEQTFNLNLTGVSAPGRIQLAGGGSTTHVIQLANLDERRFLNGGAMGFDVTVDVVAISAAPAMVEARFSGTLGSSAGAPLVIEDGHVRCTE
jgi:hypothetical protein